MNPEVLRKVSTIQEFFKVAPEGEMAEGTKLLLEAMTEVTIKKGEDIVTYGNTCDDGMYIILSGEAGVFSSNDDLLNTLGEGDFIGELGLINDDKRAATVRANVDTKCANISKQLFEDIASMNRKIYGTFMNMLYTKTTKLITERERIKSELAVATQIQLGCLENDFTEFNKMEGINVKACTRPAKEVGGDFYDIFKIDDTHLCFLIADVSGKGVPAALFMSMAKTHIKNYTSLGLPLDDVAYRVNNQLCYKNEAGMFVTVFLCVIDIETGNVNYINAGHNRPFVLNEENTFEMVMAKANLPFGMMEDMPYKLQTMQLNKGDCIYLYTDGVTEALNDKDEFFGDAYLKEVLDKNVSNAAITEEFVSNMYDAVDEFANGAAQADDITMLYLSRK